MKKTISAVLAFIFIAALSGCNSSTTSTEESLNSTTGTGESITSTGSDSSETVNPGINESDYKIENLVFDNTKIIENSPNSGKWEKISFKFPRICKESADRLVKMAEGYGIENVSKDDMEMRLFEPYDTQWGDEFAPFSAYDKFPTAEVYDENYPFINILYCTDDFYAEVQNQTGGMIELDNRKNIKSILGINVDYKAPWRPTFGGRKEESVADNDETTTCILNGKTVKVADAIKNAEKFVAENDILFPKMFGAKPRDICITTYDNGNQSLRFDFEYLIDGVVLDGAMSLSIEDENGNEYAQYPVPVQCAMLTENTIDWIWFPVIDGSVSMDREECKLSVSREQAAEIVSKKLSQESKYEVQEIQLMYAAQRAESGYSYIEPKWRFYLTGIKAQEYGKLYVYVSAVDGSIQISRVMR